LRKVFPQKQDKRKNSNIKVIDISKINGVIWLDIEENEQLREIHNTLNKKLWERFEVPEIKFDGQNFKFHSTLFQDMESDDKLTDMFPILRKEFEFPIEFETNEINFGISEVGKVGTYKVIMDDM